MILTVNIETRVQRSFTTLKECCRQNQGWSYDYLRNCNLKEPKYYKGHYLVKKKPNQ